MNIRPIQEQDDAPLYQIIRQCLADAHLNQPGTAYYDPELAHLSRFYQAAGRAYLVATNDAGQVLGGIGFGEYEPENGIAEVQKLYLSPNARGQHGGRQLLQACEEAARVAGWQTLYLETHTNLGVAIHLYETSGYKRIPTPLHEGPHTTMDHFYVKGIG